jgi:hypothetical protein
MKREWYVHATPAKGHFPSEAFIDQLTGNANRVVYGPFTSAIEAAQFVEERIPADLWRVVWIIGKRVKE